MSFTFLTVLIVYYIKRVLESYWCSSSIACQEKRADWILRIFTFNDKNALYLPIITTLQSFFRVSDQGLIQLEIKPLDISQTSRIVGLILKNASFFQTSFYFLLIILDNTSHKFWEQFPSAPDQCCFQVSETVSCPKFWCCFSSNIL